MARRRARKADDSAALRPSATAPADLAKLREAPHRAHARVRLALVAGWRTVVPGNRAAAMEFQPSRRNFRDGRPSRRAPGGHCARVEHHPRHKWRKCVRFFGAVAAWLTPRMDSARDTTGEDAGEVARKLADQMERLRGVNGRRSARSAHGHVA